MSEEMKLILLKAKQKDKWVPLNLLKPYDVDSVNLWRLEDKGMLWIKHHEDAGYLLKLTLKGYHYLNHDEGE